MDTAQTNISIDIGGTFTDIVGRFGGENGAAGSVRLADGVKLRGKGTSSWCLLGDVSSWSPQAVAVTAERSPSPAPA
jgi:hypothetical protein